jgi:glycosyltransferase involved in cell wall biosynthesis
MIEICLSTYNGAQFLNEQLASLESQDYDPSKLKLIIRDDGSTDKSFALLQDFISKTSLHVRLLEGKTNLGVKKSFEFLMSKALESNAQYIMFCDQDDVWHSDKISKTMAMMQRIEISTPNQPILIHSDVSVVDRDLAILHNSFWKFQHIDPSKDSLNQLLLHNTVTGCTMMINRSLALKVNDIPNEAIMHDWWMAMVASAFGRIGYIDEPLMLYRQHGGNDTGAKQYGLSYWFNRFMQKPTFDKYIAQSAAFLERYQTELSQVHRIMLEDFSTLNKKNWFERRKVLIKYGIFKNGWVRNIGLMVFA